jgi:hypothetical protein
MAGAQRLGGPLALRCGGEYDEIAEMFGDLYPDVAVPKTAGRW